MQTLETRFAVVHTFWEVKRAKMKRFGKNKGT